MYACKRGTQKTGLYYLNVKCGRVFTGDGYTLAKQVTKELPICKAEWNGPKEVEDRRGEKYTLSGYLKVQFKTPDGLLVAKEIVDRLVGVPMDEIQIDDENTVEKPILNVEIRGNALAIRGDTFDLDDWLNNKLNGKWDSGERAVLVPVTDDEDRATALATLRNLCRYLGYDLAEEARCFPPTCHMPLTCHYPSCAECVRMERRTYIRSTSNKQQEMDCGMVESMCALYILILSICLHENWAQPTSKLTGTVHQHIILHSSHLFYIHNMQWGGFGGAGPPKVTLPLLSALLTSASRF